MFGVRSPLGVVELLSLFRLFRLGSKQCALEISRDQLIVASLSVEVADTLFRRARGLMGRTSLDGEGGMLFIYPWARIVRIWMSGVPISLDVLFIDRSGTIIKIAPNLQPYSKKWISSDKHVKWVLEMAGGRAEQLGITLGDRIEINRG